LGTYTHRAPKDFAYFNLASLLAISSDWLTRIATSSWSVQGLASQANNLPALLSLGLLSKMTQIALLNKNR
jgi:hypothetical protein